MTHTRQRWPDIKLAALRESWHRDWIKEADVSTADKQAEADAQAHTEKWEASPEYKKRQRRLAAIHAPGAQEKWQARCREKSRWRYAPRWSMGMLHPRTKQRWRLNCGAQTNEDTWIDEQARRQRIEFRTLEMVNRLLLVHEQTAGLMGADLRRPHKDGQLWLLDSVETRCRMLPNVKHQVFLPSVAREARSSLIREFEKWAFGKRIHYFVITTGQRCGLDDLNERFQWCHKMLTEFFARPEFKPGGQWHGTEPVLRVDEFTTIRDEAGALSLHPHCNVAIHFGRWLDKSEYQGMMASLRAHFGTHLEDNARIENARELVKYICKYESHDDCRHEEGKLTLGVLDFTNAELARLYELRAGMKPVQCLNSFAGFRRQMRHARLKVVRKCIAGKMHLTVDPMNPKRPAEAPSDEPSSETDVLITVTDPQSVFSPVARPVVIVRNFTGDFAGLHRKYPQLSELKRQVQAWEEERRAYEQAAREAAAALEVHNFTETLKETWSKAPPDPASWWIPDGETVEASLEST